jgi:hypothetical protein
VGDVAQGGARVSEAADAEETPNGADAAFAKRQADAQFTVVGPAPAWARTWPGGKKPKSKQ